MKFLFKGFIKKLRAKLALITMPIDPLSLKILNVLGSHVGYIVSIELCHGILLTCFSHHSPLIYVLVCYINVCFSFA